MELKSIFQESTRNELTTRINLLNNENEPQWGKMTIGQMAKHMVIWNEWVLGKGNYTYKQEFLGKILGKPMLKKHTIDGTSMGKGIPAGKAFKVKDEQKDLTSLKTSWINLINAYADYSNPGFIHDFYGKMTKEQIGIFAYKHADHHLRQFNG